MNSLNGLSSGAGEQVFHSAFAHAAVGMAIMDTDGRFLEVNPAFCRISGYSAEELIAVEFLSIVHPEDRPVRYSLRQQLLSGAVESFVREVRMIQKDGSLVWARNSASLATSPGQPPRIVVLTEDITERKGIEEKLRTSEETFRIAAENASDIVYEWDLRTGKVTTYGMRPDRLGGRKTPEHIDDFKRMVHPDDVERVVSGLQRQIENGEPYFCEYRILGEDGAVYFSSDRGVALRNAVGEPYKWVGLVTDITERKRAEEAVSQLAAIVRSSEDAIVGLNLAGCITSWNYGAEKLLGLTGIEILGQSASVLSPGDPGGEELLALIQRASQGEASRVDETRLAGRNGNIVDVSLAISPIRRSAGGITGVSLIARDIRERKWAQQQLAHFATHDSLTGLPNRLLLAEHLEDAIARANESSSMVGAIYIDLDGFKFVNDTLGHEAGDILLKHVAQRLSVHVRPQDLLARMGGDEFMLVINQVADPDIALTVSRTLTDAMRAPFDLADRQIYITASLGISIFPRDGADGSTLRRAADAAMYEAKRSGKGQIRFFTPDIRTAYVERLELETSLRRALDEGLLSLNFQPIVRLSDQRCVAYEALARWFDPDRGCVAPARFIPVAEETGLILRLGRWVLEQACRECRTWRENGLPGVRVAVNVSAVEFDDPGFVDSVLKTLESTGLPGSSLELELTETMLMRDIELSIRKMSHLREHGIQIAVDDFGTGYSSLGYLHRLPIDTLKIDRCFVSQIGVNGSGLALITGMISLAHSISKRVVVEGVETREQLDMLRALGCDHVQGRLLGRPDLPPSNLDRQLSSLSMGLAQAGSQIEFANP